MPACVLIIGPITCLASIDSSFYESIRIESSEIVESLLVGCGGGCILYHEGDKVEGLHGKRCTLSTFFQPLLLSFSHAKATILCSFSLPKGKDTLSGRHWRFHVATGVRPANFPRRLPGSICRQARLFAVLTCWVKAWLQKVDPFEKTVHHY